MTAEETSTAKQIVDQWFWQPAEGHNYHYRGALRTLTRFYESAPMEPDVLKLVTEYLRDEVIDGGISLLNKFVDFGSGWKAMDAFYRTDETEKFAGTDSRKIRIYQILVQAPAAGDAKDGPYQVENGCQYKVSHTLYWNVNELPTVPASTSGVSYAIEGEMRDRETGLYSCVIVKRERVQQNVSEYTTSKTVFQDTTEEIHLGVKDGVAAGKAASVSKGVAVSRKITKNADCTHDVHNVTTKAKPVSNAVVEVVRNLHGTTKSVTHRNQPSPVSESGLELGERRTTRKTDLDLNDNTTVTHTPQPVGKVARSGRKTIFAESTSEHTVVVANGALPVREAAEAGGGMTHSVEVRLNDDKTADVTTTDTKERPVRDAVVEIRKTLRGTTKSVTHRNQAEPLDESGMEVGETRVSRKTDGKLYDNSTSTTRAAAPGAIAKSCEKSAAAHTDTTTKVVPAEDSEAELECVDEPEVNTVVEKAVRKNDDGKTVDVTTRKRKLKRQEGGGESKSGEGEVVTSTTRIENAEDKGELDEGGVNKQVEVSNTPNGAGGFNIVKSTTTFKPSDTKEISLRMDDTTELVFRSFRNQKDYSGFLPDEKKPGRKNLSLTKNTHGSWDGGYSITKPRTVPGYGIRIIEEAKDETFACGIRYGRWEWTNNLNVTGYFTQAWEYRRFCTMKVRYTGLTSGAADQLKQALDRLFTRTVYGSVWEPNGTPGYFEDRIVGEMRMAKITKYHIAGGVYGVLLDVNESTSRLSTNRISASGKFGIERGWSYSIPSGGENIG